MKKRNFVSVVLGLLFAAALILMPAAKVSAEGPEVQYVDVIVGTDGKLTTDTKSIKDYTVVSAPGTLDQTWTSGWYVVNSTIKTDNYFIVEGDVKLILCDGYELSTTHINVSGDGNSLTIYGQANETGKLTIDVGDEGYWAGIGGADSTAIKDGSNITINGGIVTATGGEYAAGIGGGYFGNGSNITINGGTVTATGGENAAGIGGGYFGNGSNITINGGTVTATGGKNGAGIGGGADGSSERISINGGTVISLSPSVVIAANKAGSRALLGILTIAPSATYSVDVYSNSDCTDKVTEFSFDKDEESGEFYVSLVSPIESGRYYYKFTYSDNDSTPVTKTGWISSANELTKDDFTVENAKCVYSGNEQYPTVACNYSTATVNYYFFDAGTHKNVGSPVSAGTYDIYADINEKLYETPMFIGNYVSVSDDNTYESGGVWLGTFIIEKSTPEAPANLTGV